MSKRRKKRVKVVTFGGKKRTKLVTYGNWEIPPYPSGGDALKAIERMAEILRGVIEFPTTPSRWVVELDDLRMGCEAIRKRLRDNSFARKILEQPEAAGVDSGKQRLVGRGRRPDAKIVKV